MKITVLTYNDRAEVLGKVIASTYKPSAPITIETELESDLGGDDFWDKALTPGYWDDKDSSVEEASVVVVAAPQHLQDAVMMFCRENHTERFTEVVSLDWEHSENLCFELGCFMAGKLTETDTAFNINCTVVYSL